MPNLVLIFIFIGVFSVLPSEVTGSRKRYDDEQWISSQEEHLRAANDNAHISSKRKMTPFFPGNIEGRMYRKSNDKFQVIRDDDSDGKVSQVRGYYPGFIPGKPNRDTNGKNSQVRGYYPGFIPKRPGRDGDSDGKVSQVRGYYPGFIPRKPNREINGKNSQVRGYYPGFIPRRPGRESGSSSLRDGNHEAKRDLSNMRLQTADKTVQKRYFWNVYSKLYRGNDKSQRYRGSKTYKPKELTPGKIAYKKQRPPATYN